MWMLLAISIGGADGAHEDELLRVVIYTAIHQTAEAQLPNQIDS